MAPDKIVRDPVAAPFLMGMAVRTKDFAALKGVAVVVTFIITTTAGVSVFYAQTSAMINEGKAFRHEVTQELVKIKREVSSIQQSLAITNNNVGHIREDINNITSKVDEIISYKVKIRR